MKTASIQGLLVVDKPGGMTSRDVVDRVLRWFPRGTKIGHTGTLDPLATGVLVLCIGQATRLAEYVQRMGKTYRAGILLGCTSDTDDADGTITAIANVTPPSRAAVAECLSGFVGTIYQTPPAYSAAKVAGRRAYALARKGREPNLEPRRVRIDTADLVSFDYPRLQIEVRCGKGTYIRSLARDVGQRLGCGGLIETLRRTAVGEFAEEIALPLNSDAAAMMASLLPMQAAVKGLPRILLDEVQVAKVRQGGTVAVEVRDVLAAEEAALFDERGNLVAVAHVDQASGALRPDKVMAR